MYSPEEIAKRYSLVGASKTSQGLGRMFVLAIFAGAFIALGAFGSQVVSVGASVASVGRLLSALVFPVGLLMVLVAGAELFTGNSLIIVSVLDGKTSVIKMLRNWGVVYAGNFAGSVLVALLLVYSHSYSLFDEGLAKTAVNTAVSKIGLSFGDAFFRGVLCNILVCIAVWISFSAKELAGKILGLFLPIMLFVVSGYEHCVANMYFLPAGLLVTREYGLQEGASITWNSIFVCNLLPVTIGNIIGGACLVGCGYYYTYLKEAKTDGRESQHHGGL
ncbi:MAG: formate/nitrite transporter family protein [Lachnospiraceae bacterium]|nr:formate/nitrite transporter family protein [Lachnospiraceae bacterium]